MSGKQNAMTKQSSLKTAGQLIVENLNWVILFPLIVFGIVFSDNFGTWNNVSNVLKQVSINGVLAAGFTIVILADGFDLFYWYHYFYLCSWWR